MRKKKFDGCDYWTHVIVEGYCFFSFASKKKMKFKSFPQKKGEKWVEKDNCQYIDPKIRPKECEEKICYVCLESKCPFFGYGDSTVKINKALDFYWSISSGLDNLKYRIADLPFLDTCAGCEKLLFRKSLCKKCKENLK